MRNSANEWTETYVSMVNFGIALGNTDNPLENESPHRAGNFAHRNFRNCDNFITILTDWINLHHAEGVENFIFSLFNLTKSE